MAAAFILCVPFYYVLRLWTRDYSKNGHWITDLFTAVALLAFVYVVGRWDLVGLPLRFWFCSVGVVISVCSFVRFVPPVQYESLSPMGSIRLLKILDPVVLFAAVIWVVSGYSTASPALELDSPMRGNSYFVAQGGENPIINYHGIFKTSERYAIDITQIGAWGMRARGLYPDRLQDYFAFGDTVFAPLSGRILFVENDIVDQRPSITRNDRPGGNEIRIAKGDTVVVLSHLQHGSISVQEGENIIRGQPIGRIGNTGFTSEPHLHVHAVVVHGRPDRSSLDVNQALPLPIRINGRFLARNDRLPPR